MNETMTLKEGAEAIEGLYSFLFAQCSDSGLVGRDESNADAGECDAIRDLASTLVKHRWVTDDPRRVKSGVPVAAQRVPVGKPATRSIGVPYASGGYVVTTPDGVTQ